MPEGLSPAIERKWSEKLYNWSLWYVGSGTGQYASPSAYERVEKQEFKADGEARTWEAYTRDPSSLVGEALDTNALLAQLAPDLFDAIKARYCWIGTEVQQAADLGIPRSTLQSRVSAAKIELERLDGIRRRSAFRPPQSVP